MADDFILRRVVDEVNGKRMNNYGQRFQYLEPCSYSSFFAGPLREVASDATEAFSSLFMRLRAFNRRGAALGQFCGSLAVPWPYTRPEPQPAAMNQQTRKLHCRWGLCV